MMMHTLRLILALAATSLGGFGSTAMAASPPAPPAPAATAPQVAPAAAADNNAIPLDDAAYQAMVSRLDREHYILQLESKNAELKKKLAAVPSANLDLPPPSIIVSPPAGMTPQNGTTGVVAPVPASHGTTVAHVTLPDFGAAPARPAPLRVTEVLGVAGRYQATVVDHGVDNIVHEGSTLSDGWYIQRIAPSTVLMVRGRHHRLLHVGP